MYEDVWKEGDAQRCCDGRCDAACHAGVFVRVRVRFPRARAACLGAHHHHLGCHLRVSGPEGKSALEGLTGDAMLPRPESRIGQSVEHDGVLDPQTGRPQVQVQGLLVSRGDEMYLCPRLEHRRCIYVTILSTGDAYISPSSSRLVTVSVVYRHQRTQAAFHPHLLVIPGEVC